MPMVTTMPVSAHSQYQVQTTAKRTRAGNHLIRIQTSAIQPQRRKEYWRRCRWKPLTSYLMIKCVFLHTVNITCPKECGVEHRS